MKKYLYNSVAILIVWITSGVCLCFHQHGYHLIGYIVAFFSLLAIPFMNYKNN